MPLKYNHRIKHGIPTLKLRNRSYSKYEIIQYFYFSKIAKCSCIRKRRTNYLNCHRTDARFNYITSTGPQGSWPSGKERVNPNDRDHATCRTQKDPLFLLFVQQEIGCLFLIQFECFNLVT